jgi:hypothetical protein
MTIAVDHVYIQIDRCILHGLALQELCALHSVLAFSRFVFSLWKIFFPSEIGEALAKSTLPSIKHGSKRCKLPLLEATFLSRTSADSLLLRCSIHLTRLGYFLNDYLRLGARGEQWVRQNTALFLQ